MVNHHHHHHYHPHPRPDHLAGVGLVVNVVLIPRKPHSQSSTGLSVPLERVAPPPRGPLANPRPLHEYQSQ